MSAEESVIQKEIDERLGRDEARVRVWFYPHGVLSHDETEKRGYPYYIDVPYIARRHETDRDFISRPASAEDIANHPDEWVTYEKVKERYNTPTVLVLCGVTPAIKKAFGDMKVITLQQLADADGVSPQIKPFQIQARMLLRAYTEKPRLRPEDLK